MSWKPEVIADNSGKWNSNGLRFATKAEAELYVRDLAGRWMSVREWRAVECDDPATHAWVYDRAERIAVFYLDKESDD